MCPQFLKIHSEGRHRGFLGGQKWLWLFLPFSPCKNSLVCKEWHNSNCWAEISNLTITCILSPYWTIPTAWHLVHPVEKYGDDVLTNYLADLLEVQGVTELRREQWRPSAVCGPWTSLTPDMEDFEPDRTRPGAVTTRDQHFSTVLKSVVPLCHSSLEGDNRTTAEK